MAAASSTPEEGVAGDKKPFDSAHYKWAEEMKRRGEELKALGVDTTPKAIDAGSAEADDAGDALAKSKSKGSAWNTGGTWEDRDTSEWLKDALTARLLAASADVTVGARAARIAFSAVDKCEGSSSVVYVRGKAKPGFEIKLKASFSLTAVDDATVVLGKGTVSADEMCDYDGFDFDLAVRASAEAGSGAASSDCKRAAGKSKDLVTESLRAAVDEMASM